MTDDRFRLVGVRPQSPAAPVRRAPWYRGKPIFSAAVLTLIVLGCLFCEVLLTHDPTYLDLAHCNEAPSREFLFGTDPMGRDIFSMIWYGGRISLTIGVLSTLLSTAIAILFGTVSGCAPDWLDRLLMRLTEILLSVPNLLLVVLLQAILGTANVLTLSLVIGLTSWASIAKVVRTEVRRLRSSEYVLASRCMGGGGGLSAGTYLTASVSHQDMEVTVTGAGTITPIHSFRVTSLVSGEILEAPFEEGDSVKKGDVLFRIDPKDVESNIQQQEIICATRSSATRRCWPVSPTAAR